MYSAECWCLVLLASSLIFTYYTTYTCLGRYPVSWSVRGFPPPAPFRVRASLCEACFGLVQEGPPLRLGAFVTWDYRLWALASIQPHLISQCLAPRYALRNLIHNWKKSAWYLQASRTVRLFYINSAAKKQLSPRP